MILVECTLYIIFNHKHTEVYHYSPKLFSGKIYFYILQHEKYNINIITGMQYKPEIINYINNY